MKDWQTEMFVEERALKLRGKDFRSQKKLIYEWVKIDLISFTVFDRLLSLIGENNEESNTKRTE